MSFDNNSTKQKLKNDLIEDILNEHRLSSALLLKRKSNCF